MKQVLLGGTALVAVGTAMGAMAQPALASSPISLSVGGWYENVITFSDQGGNLQDSQFRHEGELLFSGSTTLDNGLIVGFEANLELVNRPDGMMDEVFMYFEGSFGQLQLGANDGAAYQLHYVAPYVGLGLNSPNFGPYNANGAPTASYLGGSGLANKITYFTPKFSGFQFGLSYVPDDVDPDGTQSGNFGIRNKNLVSQQENIVSLAAAYEREVGDLTLGLSGGYEFGSLQANDAAGTFDDYKAYSLGLNIGYGPILVGGSYAKFNNGLAGDNDGKIWDVGVSYTTGPWGFSLTHLNSKDEGSGDKMKLYDVAASYELAAGIRLASGVIFGDIDPAPAGSDDSVVSFYIGTFLTF